LATGGTEALGINDMGQIVGTYDNATGSHAFLYSGGSYTTIDDPLANGTHAFGINNVGQIVGRYFNGSSEHGFLLTITPNPPPPPGTTADMILRRADGTYEIYDIGNNAILAGYELGHVGTDWAFVTLGGFNGSDTTDMLLRSASTGSFAVYDISHNLITNTALAFLGTVGLDWQVMGFGNFSSVGENDMILRNSSSGGVEVYDIRNNQITGASFLGTVGLNWQFSGVGNFSSLGESDMLLRNSNTGGLEVYDIANSQITNAAFIGTVGVDWQFSGVGNFSGNPGETDLLLRNNKTGGLEVYDISNNQLTGAAFIGTIGLDWQFAAIAPVHAPGASDLVLRNLNTGQFEVYDIAGNTLIGAASLGAVGLDWQLGGFAVDPPTGSIGSSDDLTSQLVQAMAGFVGGAGAPDSFNAVTLGADTS
jgi:probable HAF family extracellular repeat protein